MDVLGCSGKDTVSNDPIVHLEKLFASKKKKEFHVLLLDEMDVLDPEDLYRIFEWSFRDDFRLVLIGIANALDLTDRILPRLRSKNCMLFL